jgi:hypothetical protein
VVEPLSVKKLSPAGGQVFIRKITRRRHWEEPLQQRDSAAAGSIFDDEQNLTSLWRVETDLDLRRVALALNEGRSSPHEEIYLVPIVPHLLTDAGLSLVPSGGATDCPEARMLHFDVPMVADKRAALAQLLIQAGTGSIHLKKAEMVAAEKASALEGCFAALRESTHCLACGATR